MTIQSIEAELKRVERRREILRRQLEDRRTKQFTAIPAKYGFKSMDAFIVALSPYASSRIKLRLADESASAVPRPARTAIPAKAAGGGRTKYTEQHKAAVKAALA